MRLVGLLLLCALACSSVTVASAQDDPYRRVRLRITSVGQERTVVVDRGARDKVAGGDLVHFFPRSGGRYAGVVVRVDERSAVVEVTDPGLKPTVGMRGEVRIPRARAERVVRPSEPDPKPAEPVPQEPKPAEPSAGANAPGVKVTWENKDDAYKPGMPLLAGVKPLQPEDRRRRVTGRIYSSGALTHTEFDGWANSFFRIGTALDVDNAFGYGGRFQLDTEINYKKEQNDKSGLDILPRRLSYALGGTRFDEARWEIGRFLPVGMPEFGVLDGVEWMRRGERSSFGAAIGFLPEPTDDFETGADFQVSAFYQWTSDVHEQLTITAGLQKTWHHGKSDRDLIVAKVRSIPLDGWEMRATTWIDVYYGRDQLKDGVELTQAVASIGRRFDNGDELDLVYTRYRFPELLRTAYLPPDARDIDRNHYDRLALEGWFGLGDSTRFHGSLSGFNDEDDAGGAAEAGLEFLDVFAGGDRLDLTAFGTLADFESDAGGRISYGRIGATGRWELFYEFSNRHQVGFDDRLNDLVQHRVRASGGLSFGRGWDGSVYLDTVFFDRDTSVSFGFFLQRSF